MRNNQDTNKPEVKAEAKWYDIPLKDWAVIVSALTFLISNAGGKAGSEEKLSGFSGSLSEINSTLKEIKQKQESSDKEKTDTDNKQNIEIEVLKARVKSLEEKK